MDTKPLCRLCDHHLEFFQETKKRQYYRCPHCDSIQLEERQILDKQTEKKRYDTHNNDVFDLGYQKFVSPITQYIFRTFSSNQLGLDFGAGPGPVISKLLIDKGYQINQYDPFYQPNKDVLNHSYDYIVACEVIEHFNHPKQEFDLLKTLTHKKGQWIFMTEIYDDSIDFTEWYYKNDETHIIFYTHKTFNYLKDTYGFNHLAIDKRLIILSH